MACSAPADAVPQSLMDIVVDDLHHCDQQGIAQRTDAHGLIVVQFEAHQHHHDGDQPECDALGYASSV